MICVCLYAVGKSGARNQSNSEDDIEQVTKFKYTNWDNKDKISSVADCEADRQDHLHTAGITKPQNSQEHVMQQINKAMKWSEAGCAVNEQGHYTLRASQG